MISFAHSREGQPKTDWQPLEEHLRAVARLASRSTGKFGAADWGQLAGLWHDLGKYSEAFQNYLLASASADPHVAEVRSGVDHSSAGAQHAYAAVSPLGQLLAYVIAGHHAGLLDAHSDGACLRKRLHKKLEPWTRAPREILDQPEPSPPFFLREALGRRKDFTVAFFTRMLFSALADADFLDTEAFMSPGRADARPTWPLDILARIEAELDRHVAEFQPDDSEVGRARAGVRKACLDAADQSPGFFSLTVPTGGGKTLSSLAFALRHARQHSMDRIVYVAPFTTIIEQNAEVFRGLTRRMGGIPDPVVEHHSDLDVGDETAASRLATENWDAPLVVTTSVQFYESLFANRPARCRKLHNLARSVVILDEVQALPVDFLEPCLRALEELTEHYATTVVLCTATQPAVHWREDFEVGLSGVREIVADPPKLYRDLERVAIEDIGSMSDDDLAARLLAEPQVLCVVNTRRHARKLFEQLGAGDEHFHLSALMCAAHRRQTLARVHEQLGAKRPCRVVSTQLIEAGVDIDFPAVYRSLAGLDSIAQAAGRCNRNGRLKQGRTFVFRSEHTRSETFFAETASCARQVLSMHTDPLEPKAIEHYFRLYYWEQKHRWDAHAILQDFDLVQDMDFPFLFDFASAADRFRLIEDNGRPVIVPWGREGADLCTRLRATHRPPPRDLLRRLQRYSVRVPVAVWEASIGGAIEFVDERYGVLTSLDLYYSEQFGLDLEAATNAVLIR